MKKSLLKKVLSCTLIASMAFSVAACSGNAEDADTNNDTDETEAAAETTVEETEAEAATREIEYQCELFTVRVTVPEDSDYEFTTEIPENTNFTSGECYLVGGSIAVSIAKLDLQLDPWDTCVELWLANNEGSELTTFAGREAVRFEYRMTGTDADGVYGYRYNIETNDISTNWGAKIIVVVADWDPNSTEAVFADPEVQAILDSIVIEAN